MTQSGPVCRDISALPFVFSLAVNECLGWSTGLLQLLFTHIVMLPYCFRQEFVSDQCPDLTREVYLQDIHCVGSLCKLYFRELPNPLLTYELYKKFTVRPLAVLVPLQQCGCAADSSMTAVWDSLQCPGFWCIYPYKHFSVLFPSHLVLAVFPCSCFFSPFHVYFSQFVCCFLPFLLLIFSLHCFPTASLSPHCAPPPSTTNSLSFPHY